MSADWSMGLPSIVAVAAAVAVVVQSTASLRGYVQRHGPGSSSSGLRWLLAGIAVCAFAASAGLTSQAISSSIAPGGRDSWAAGIAEGLVAVAVLAGLGAMAVGLRRILADLPRGQRAERAVPTALGARAPRAAATNESAGQGTDRVRLLDLAVRQRSLYQHLPAVFFTFDADGRIESCSRYAAEQLGYSPDELVGMDAAAIYAERGHEIVETYLRRCLESGDTVSLESVGHRSRSGAISWVRESARGVAGPAESGRTVLVVREDVSEARVLSYHLTHDELTGLFNRRELESRIGEAIRSTAEGQVEHALCHVDLDRFRIVNDAGGRTAGDALLCEVAALLERAVRRQDTVARLHGDEFAVLMTSCELSQARSVADNLRRQIERLEFVAPDGTPFALSASIGVTGIVSGYESSSNVLAAADDACQLAKDKGGNRVHVLHDHRLDIERRREDVQWVSRINRAIEEDRLVLFGQPIEGLAAGSDDRLRFEVLLRMREEDGSLTPAAELLPRVERYHLAGRVDRWVVEHTLAALDHALDRGQEVALCAINLSGQSLCDEGFLEFVVQALDHSRADASVIYFEITETAVIADLANAQRFIRVLQGWGCRFALDDFGTGLCSFAYLKNLPVDLVKIDGIFVRDLVRDPVNAVMVRSINEIGHAMGMHTVAEFVESEEVRNALAAEECCVDFVQGHAVGEPRPLETLIGSPSVGVVG